jgi:phosphohistidine phosphatase SixA
MNLILLRHAKAGDRIEWRGDDRQRPLTRKGLKQARQLVELLAGVPMAHVYTSPFRRCIETVQPLAAARRLSIESVAELMEGSDPQESLAWMLDLTESAVLCSHGDVIEGVRELLEQAGVRCAYEDYTEKGGGWLLDIQGSKVVKARYLRAP